MTHDEAQALVAEWLKDGRPGESLVGMIARHLSEHVAELSEKLTAAEELARLGGWKA